MRAACGGAFAALAALPAASQTVAAQEVPAETAAPVAEPSPECRARTSEFFDYALRNKEAITLGQLERSDVAWKVRRACGDLPGLLSNAVNAQRVPKASAPRGDRGEAGDEWVVPLLFFGLLVHDIAR